MIVYFIQDLNGNLIRKTWNENRHLCIFFFLKADEIISVFEQREIKISEERERITQEIFNNNYTL